MQRLRRQMSTWGQDRLKSADERALAGRVSGLLWLSGAATLLLALPLPGGRLLSAQLVVVIAGFAAAWGAAMLRLSRSSRTPVAVWHLSSMLGLVVVAVLGPLTGGTDSATRDYVWFAVVYAAFFYSPRQALLYWLASAAVHALPLAYDEQAVEDNLVRELLIAVPIYCVVGGIVVAGRELLDRRSREAAALGRAQERLADEQSSLRRVATAVAAGSPPRALFALICSEVGRLLAADAAGISRYVGDTGVQLIGSWSVDGDRQIAAATISELAADALAGVHRTNPALRADGDGRRPGAPEYRSVLAASVSVGQTPWGALTVAARRPHAFDPRAQEALGSYAELIATAAANAEDRQRLENQPGADLLTGLPNHVAFRERLREEVSRARRHRRPLTVAIADVDGLRAMNDRGGHKAGDVVLRDVADLLRSSLREEDVVSRLGADDFGILLVESDRATALVALERVRRLVARTPLGHGLQATISIGLAELDGAPTGDDLLGAAEAALHWSRAHGPDRSWVYDPDVARDLTAGARRPALERSRAVRGLRALARAIDAKDPATAEHSERVAALAGRLATVRGWSPEHIERLREAALLHDVGKIGLPDPVLLKSGPLDERETALVRDHPALGAQIAADVLDHEQVEWIAGHHERPDGGGYPRGLSGEAISEGAALLALADAWDSMVSHRSYSGPRDVEEALAECRALIGAQFTEDAVEVLEILHDRGELTMAAARLHRPTRESPLAALARRPR